MEGKDKATILLAEYSTLRQEVIAARVNVSQAFAVFASAIMADVGFGFSYGARIAVVAIAMFAVLYLGILVVWNEKNVTCFTRRLREIEKEIDSSGERVLVWETTHGWGNMFYKSNPNFRGYVTPEKSTLQNQHAVQPQIKTQNDISR